jgi:hypothetical protein
MLGQDGRTEMEKKKRKDVWEAADKIAVYRTNR